MDKKWYESKTLRFNAACAALIALEASLGVIQPLMPVNVYAILSLALTVGNAVLRVITSQGLTK